MRIAISIILNGKHHLIKQITPMIAGFDKWIIVEGASKNTFCTSWCKDMPEKYHKDGSSIDGTVEYIKEIQSTICTGAEIKLIQTEGFWDGKVAMFNAALEYIDYPCHLWQVDIDEYWEPWQLENAEKILENTDTDVGIFTCNYMLSHDIVVRGDWGESIKHGYKRLWKYQPGRKFISHEPPKIEGEGKALPPAYMPKFLHKSYYYKQDVEFKAAWYNKHEHILDGWKDIVQGVTKLPCRIESLFRNEVPEDWKNTIITYK